MILNTSKDNKYTMQLLQQSRKPTGKLKRWLIVSILVCFLCASSLAYTFVSLSIVSDTGASMPLAYYDTSAVPQSVFDDATRLAQKLYGDSRQQCDIFVNQLLATYTQACDKDFVILFNPGGWGGSPVTTSPDWMSILNGIQSKLDESGYRSLALNYQRTVNTTQARLNELMEMFTGYSSKAGVLASRIDFLTRHYPDLKIILTGESTGSMIVDDVMRILGNDKNVYSIQTGAPFWHESTKLDQSLQITNNGIVPDSFSEGNITSIIFATVGSWFSSSPRGEATLMNFLVAPGHEYSWQNPGVYTQIEKFLQKNFGVKPL